MEVENTNGGDIFAAVRLQLLNIILSSDPDLWHFFLRFLTSGDLHVWPFELKISTDVTTAVGSLHTNFGFPAPFVFKLGARTWRTDRRTDGQDPYYGILGRPHVWRRRLEEVEPRVRMRGVPWRRRRGSRWGPWLWTRRQSSASSRRRCPTVSCRRGVERSGQTQSLGSTSPSCYRAPVPHTYHIDTYTCISPAA